MEKSGLRPLSNVVLAKARIHYPWEQFGEDIQLFFVGTCTAGLRCIARYGS